VKPFSRSASWIAMMAFVHVKNISRALTVASARTLAGAPPPASNRPPTHGYGVPLRASSWCFPAVSYMSERDRDSHLDEENLAMVAAAGSSAVGCVRSIRRGTGCSCSWFVSVLFG
jgi:hypothetical protein